ncbi:MAG: hypothetical protein V2J25_03575 [Desulfatiglans sp.]|jgi:hypothetical protein|nr:hypothetical protein [Thermodesulfobacteriota bacterium]MEE4351927.1 hypothetical protein [Desulfatiglans sp.]
MMKLDELKKDLDLINAIDWEMTPEEAVRLYLEWGNNWSQGKQMVNSKSDVSHYFVLNTWEDDPVIYLIRRNSEGSVELAELDLPNELKDHIKATHKRKGTYGLDGKAKQWLKEELDAA